MTGRLLPSKILAVTAASQIAMMLGGCAADQAVVDNLVTVPSYYDTLDCPELVGQFQSATLRVKELTGLIERSSNSPGGPVVSAMAYNTDYAKARATRHYAEEAAVRKGCDLTKKVDAKKSGADAPDVKRPDLDLPTSRFPGH